MKKTLLEKKMEEILNKLVKKDNEKPSFICIDESKNGYKTYTRKSKSNKVYQRYLAQKKEQK